jgi:hypothetical protein
VLQIFVNITHLFFSFEAFKVEDVLYNPDWVVAMQEELNNFKSNELWSLIEKQSKILYVPNEYFVTSKMSIELSQGTKYDL